MQKEATEYKFGFGFSFSLFASFYLFFDFTINNRRTSNTCMYFYQESRTYFFVKNRKLFTPFYPDYPILLDKDIIRPGKSINLNEVIMYQFKRNGVSVKAILDKRQKNRHGLYPIRICVIYRRIPKYFVTDQAMTEAGWELLQYSDDNQQKQIRECIRERFELIATITNKLIEHREFSFDTLRSEFVKYTTPSYFIDNPQERE